MSDSTSYTDEQPQKVIWRIAGYGLLLIGILLIGYIIISFSRNTSPLNVIDAKDESTVFFSTTRDSVVHPLNCVTLVWEVENIWSVYLNDDGVIGQDSRTWCIHSDGTRPTLRVRFPEDVWEEYPLTIQVGTGQFEFLLGFIAIISGGYLLRFPPLVWMKDQLQKRQEFSTMLLSLWISGVVFIYWISINMPGHRTILRIVESIQRFLFETLTAPYLG